ncbi:insulin-like growth factor-binding protein-related protein 1 [Daphnia pulex]|uniref:insulin-like growth factor-binding protein-related protein 1 n=1 Tax=Daphnia pulex TaxID=6669 RepID=UPI001EE0F3E0|nr:insulin-like growth factor-binding protein-related protein 1 [Daphnia pulex]
MWKFTIIYSLALLVIAVSEVKADETVDETDLDDEAMGECGICRKEECSPASDCRAGLVLDRCGCCNVCGRIEGEKCDNYTLPLQYKDRYGFCGDNMACLLRNDMEDLDINEALCYCKKPGAVCGTDLRTYASVCKLRQEAIQRGDDDLAVRDWGPCETHPVISSAPENVTANIHDDLALSCEARGYPIPSLIWEFESAATGKKTKLPGDDQMIALQVRGGPEPYMISSWIQILRVRSTDAGIFSCTVVSKKGIVRAEGTVTVAKRVKIKSSQSQTKPPTPTTPVPVFLPLPPSTTSTASHNNPNGPKFNGPRRSNNNNRSRAPRKQPVYEPSG